MTEGLVYIRTDKSYKDEIKVIEESIKEWNYDWIVDIAYVGESETDNLDVSFTLRHDDSGELLWVIFGSGHKYTYKR